jgi:hypothetical protein
MIKNSKRLSSNSFLLFIIFFRPNLVMGASSFSSTIALNKTNLKNEFPRIKGIK